MCIVLCRHKVRLIRFHPITTMYHSFMWREKEEKNQKLSHHRYNQKSLNYRKLCYLLLTLLLFDLWNAQTKDRNLT